MKKRPFVTQFTLFLTTAILLGIALIVLQLPQARPAAAGSAQQTTTGVCTRFSLDQGANAATGAGVNGRYEMREVTSGRVVAAWQADAAAANSGWLTDLPPVSAGGSWVAVYFYPDGGETAVLLNVLNPAPNTAYGWVANSQCHAIELQFPPSWRADNQSPGNGESGVGGGIANEEGTSEAETSQGEAVEEGSWMPNLTSIRPIPNTQFRNAPDYLELADLGAWVDSETTMKVVGFSLTNPSANQTITNLTIQVNAFDAAGTLLFADQVAVRDIFPAETAAVGHAFPLPNMPGDNGVNDDAIDLIEVEFVSAERLPLEEEPAPLLLLPPARPGIDPPPIGIKDDQFSVDANSLVVALELFNPNGRFTAADVTVAITAFDENGDTLLQFEGGGADVPPRQNWRLSGSIPLEFPDRVAGVDVTVNVAQFIAVDPTTLPQSILQTQDFVLANQHLAVVISPMSGLPFAAEQILRGDEAVVFTIARNDNGDVIGGGYVFLDPFASFASDLYALPVQASDLPAAVDGYVNVDTVDAPNRRGGGGNQVGRDNFPVEFFGVTVSE